VLYSPTLISHFHKLQHFLSKWYQEYKLSNKKKTSLSGPCLPDNFTDLHCKGFKNRVSHACSINEHAPVERAIRN
jgi:hypothetical protein